MDENTILQRAARASFEIVAEEAILIDLNTGTYFSLNRVGTEYWQMLDGQQTIRQHAATLADKYNVDSQIVVNDLLELSHKMLEDNLVTSVQA